MHRNLRSFRIPRVIMLMVAVTLLGAGCESDESSRLREQFLREQTRNMELRTQVRAISATSQRWQAIAFIGCTGAVVLWIVGAAMGSATRRAHQRQDQSDRRKRQQ